MTSNTGPLPAHPDATESSIRAVIGCPSGGQLVTMGFPGLVVGFDGTSYIDPEVLAATLESPALSKARFLIALAEIDELPAEHWKALQEALDRRGIALEHMPIPDFSIPDGRFLKTWERRAAEYHEVLDIGGTIGITCHYGAGRSGTIAARLMIERGLDADQAIAQVRLAFPESIESKSQFDWLHQAG